MIHKTNADTERKITIGKILLLTLNEQEEKVIDKIIAAIAGCISLDAIQTISVPASGMTFPGLEIRQSQHRHCPHTRADI